ncbi:MAG: alpha/beta fold hydrolase [Thermodesulfobacteriota bacterium]
MGKHFVLIHGAWHTGETWSGVIKALASSGHTAEAPTMPGHGPGDDRRNITLADYGRRVAEVVNRRPGKVVLVGHSSGGIMLQAATPLAAEKIERLIFLNAFIMPDGTAQLDLVPPDVARMMRQVAAADPEHCIPPDENFVRHVLVAGDPKSDQDRLLTCLVPQPVALLDTKVSTAGFNALAIPKTVVFCRDDTSLPPGAYLGLAQNLGRFDLIEIPGGHETFLFQPEVVAEALIKAVS